MASSREERLVENEELFRRANERLRERAERIVEPGESVPFLCECIDEKCMERIDLTLEVYERVRSDHEQFVIRRGHPRLDGEKIVEEEDRFLIVSKECLE